MAAEEYESNAEEESSEGDSPAAKPKKTFDVDPSNLIDLAFNIDMMSTIVCHNCGHVSVTRQNEKDIEATIPSAGLFAAPTASDAEDRQATSSGAPAAQG